MELWTTIGSILGIIAAAGVSFAITFVKTMKVKNGVQTEADKEKATKDTEKLAIAVAAYMNPAVEVDSDGNLVIKS